MLPVIRDNAVIPDVHPSQHDPARGIRNYTALVSHYLHGHRNELEMQRYLLTDGVLTAEVAQQLPASTDGTDKRTET